MDERKLLEYYEKRGLEGAYANQLRKKFGRPPIAKMKRELRFLLKTQQISEEEFKRAMNLVEKL